MGRGWNIDQQIKTFLFSFFKTNTTGNCSQITHYNKELTCKRNVSGMIEDSQHFCCIILCALHFFRHLCKFDNNNFCLLKSEGTNHSLVSTSSLNLFPKVTGCRSWQTLLPSILVEHENALPFYEPSNRALCRSPGSRAPAFRNSCGTSDCSWRFSQSRVNLVDMTWG